MDWINITFEVLGSMMLPRNMETGPHTKNPGGNIISAFHARLVTDIKGML
jgi:hypothetical protein